MSELTIEPATVATELAAFIHQAAIDLRRQGAVVGLSGGIDSAVVATLAVQALGPERVLGLILPERDSAPESRRLALRLARGLGIRCQTVRLTLPLALLGVYWRIPLWLLPTRRLKARMVQRYHARYRASLGKGETPFSAVMIGTAGLEGPWLNQTVAYHRVKVRLRMAVLYYYAELHNLLVLGSDNKTELSVGFFVKYGDSAADIAPLANLYKTQVRALAAYLQVPEEIRARPPSPDVLPGLVDEEAIGLDYTTLDRILWRLEAGHGVEEIANELGLVLDRVRYVEMLTRRAKTLQSPALCPPCLNARQRQQDNRMS